MEKVLFSEEQKYSQWWLWLIMGSTALSVVVPFSVGIYTQFVQNKPFGDHPMSTDDLVVSGIVSVFVLTIIYVMLVKARLKTKITQEGLFIAFPPIIRKWKQIIPEEIERYEVRTYRAKREYMGRGVRRGRRKYGKAYTVSGNIGLQLYFRNGKRLLIGTQKKQALEYAMKKLMEGEV